MQDLFAKSAPSISQYGRRMKELETKKRQLLEAFNYQPDSSTDITPEPYDHEDTPSPSADDYSWDQNPLGKLPSLHNNHTICSTNYYILTCQVFKSTCIMVCINIKEKPLSSTVCKLLTHFWQGCMAKTLVELSAVELATRNNHHTVSKYIKW